MSETVLHLSEFSVGFNGQKLLGPLELELGRGEIIGLKGPSGCGKTTMLRAIAGLVDPLEGELILNGEVPDTIGWPAFRRRVVLVEQNPVMLEANILENLRRPFTYRSAGDKIFDPARATAYLKRLNVSVDLEDTSAQELSVGEQQRISIVRAMLLDPEVLLLDEPTSALDELTLG